MPPTALVVADTQLLFVDAVARALDRDPSLHVSPKHPVTGADAVREVVSFRADVALLDFWITGMGGPATVRAMVKSSPSVRVIFLAEFVMGPAERQQGQACGAVGFLRKNVPLADLAAAVHWAAAADPSVKEGELQPVISRLSTLTFREIEVLQFLRQGLPNREIAADLSISVGTLKNHVHRILVKMKATTTVEAVNTAEEHGFIARASSRRP